MDFTLEVGGSSLHFLDLTFNLRPRPTDLKKAFEIYRKPTYIHHESYQPRIHKLAILNHAIHRLHHVPFTEKATPVETKTIQLITERNGLEADIPLMIRRKQLRLLSSRRTEPASDFGCHRTRWIRLLHLGNLSNIHTSKFKMYDYMLDFTHSILSPNSLPSRIESPRRNTPKSIESLVIAMLHYIGQTSRSFERSANRNAYFEERKPLNLWKISSSAPNVYNLELEEFSHRTNLKSCEYSSSPFPPTWRTWKIQSSPSSPLYIIRFET